MSKIVRFEALHLGIPFDVTLETLEYVKKLTEQEHEVDRKFGEDRENYKEGEYDAIHEETMNQLNEVIHWVNRWKELEES